MKPVVWFGFYHCTWWWSYFNIKQNIFFFVICDYMTNIQSHLPKFKITKYVQWF